MTVTAKIPGQELAAFINLALEHKTSFIVTIQLQVYFPESVEPDILELVLVSDGNKCIAHPCTGKPNETANISLLEQIISVDHMCMFLRQTLGGLKVYGLAIEGPRMTRDPTDRDIVVTHPQTGRA